MRTTLSVLIDELTVGALDPAPNTPNPCLSSMAATTAPAAAVVVVAAVVAAVGGGGGGGGGGGSGSTSNNNNHALPLQRSTGNNSCRAASQPQLPLVVAPFLSFSSRDFTTITAPVVECTMPLV